MNSMKNLENSLFKSGFKYIFGLDEAGRGPLAGPVVAGAVVWKKGIKISGLNDSKKLSPEKRERLFKIITSKLEYGVGIVSHEIIDKKGIKYATFMAFKNAIKDINKKYKINPECLLIDGIDDFKFGIPSVSIEKGDTRVKCIQAGSIIAKVTRDKIMMDFEKRYPMYGFRSHKGYGTEAHYKAISEHGVCKIHRLTFRLK